MSQIFYYFLQGITGPVTTPGFVGAFQGSDFTYGSFTQPNTGYIRIAGPMYRPEFYRFCIIGRRISSLEIIGSEGQTSFSFGTLTGVIISSVVDVPYDDRTEFQVYFNYQASSRPTRESNPGYTPPSSFVAASGDVGQRAFPAAFGVGGAAQFNKTTSATKR